MKSDIHSSALSSVGEVAVFAWSLLELLLTRILPLVGFLLTHLLLQCFHLLTAIFTNPAAPARRQRNFPRWDDDDELQQRYVDLKPVNTIATAAAEAHRVEDILQDHELLQTQQQQPIILSPADSTVEALQKATASSPPDDHLPQAPQLIAQTVDPLPTAPPSNVGEKTAMPAAPSEPGIEAASDAIAVNDLTGAPKQMQEVERPAERSAQQEASDSPAVKRVSEQDVEAAPIRESVTARQEEAAEMGSSGAAQDGEGETAKSGGRSGSRRRPAFTRILPPSLSQIKRTLMQRSRRAGTSPASSSPKPSPLNMKRQSPRLRNLASAMKSTASYENFMGAFRKHFLLDSA